LDPPFKKIARGPRSLEGGTLVRLDHFMARVRKFWGTAPLGGEIWYFKKVHLGGYDFTT